MAAKELVAVLGASPTTDRYAFRALRMLRDHQYPVAPVNPAFQEIDGEICYPSLRDIPRPVHTVTLYVGPARSTKLIEDILAIKPKRIVMNPGAENSLLAQRAHAAGVEVVEDCTLVMLRSGTF